ncbi:hypothetical protein GKA92_24440 [Salmonella enterica subsp. enterica]|nr:hypothetical protein [Salmonella enterica subsp. enterica serovar Abaetetuba]
MATSPEGVRVAMLVLMMIVSVRVLWAVCLKHLWMAGKKKPRVILSINPRRSRMLITYKDASYRPKGDDEDGMMVFRIRV